MEDRRARDIMTKDPTTIDENLSVKEAAEILLAKKIGGAPVVNAAGEMVGIISEGDLIMADVKLEFPSYIHLLDGLIYLGGLKKFEDNLKKAIGAKVKDVMTESVISAEADDSVMDVATKMVKEDVARLPVLDGGRLAGIITKADIMKDIVRGE
ncbi:MAG: CBS domain-containing protein [Actinomycetota bacterium]|nr:CBS domain-containing protein [Actinomycetota bacterium]